MRVFPQVLAKKKMRRARERENPMVSVTCQLTSAQSSPSAEACGDNTPFEVVFVKDTSATTCYGCKGKVREKPSDAPPPPPYDIFIRHLERRVYRRRGENKLHLKTTRNGLLSSNKEMLQQFGGRKKPSCK